MNISVFGLGYVGFTAMCCIAKDKHNVVGFDVNEEKISQINNGISPIVELGVDELLKAGLEQNRIIARLEIAHHLDDCDLAIVCVGTPSAKDGSHNLKYIKDVTKQIAQAVKSRQETSPLTVSYRSTIRPGTMEEIIEPIFIKELGSEYHNYIELIYNPEFLRESSAIKDYFEPPKIVIGTKDAKPNAVMNTLYKNISATTFNVHFKEAEITKFVDNSWHALKVAYANEIGRVCLGLGISAKTMHEIFISDTKLNISPYYTRPGGAFGGSCLPKDVRAFQFIANECEANTYVLNSLIDSNEAHKKRLFLHAMQSLEPKASVLLVGLAFKANTDDLRESPNVDLARDLLKHGFKLSIFDPAVKISNIIGANLDYANKYLPSISRLLVSKQTANNTNYDCIIIANDTYKQLDIGSYQNVINLNSLT